MESRFGEGGAQHVSRRYASPVDTGVKVITGLAIVTTFLALGLFSFMPRFYQVVTALFVAFTVVTLTTAYTFRPIAYGMDPEGVIIYFAWRRLRIPWHTVRAVRLEPKRKVFRAIRTLGSGGVFGYLGRYWSPALGFHIRLVTDRGRVVILFRKVPYCLSPDDPDRFVREARSYAKEEREVGVLFRRDYSRDEK